MTKITAAVTALTAAALMAAPAFSQDLSPIYSAPASSGWTGAYVGIFGGAAFNPATPGVLQIDQNLDGNFNQPLNADLGGRFGNAFFGAIEGGFTGGIAAGYDMQMDQFVVGGIVDIAYADYADRQVAVSNTPATYTELREVGVLGTIRGRAGYLVTDNMLAYVHGGLAVGDVRNSFTSPGNPNGVTTGGQGVQAGFQIGAGLETKVTDTITFGVEYAYTNLGTNNFNTRFANGPFGVVNPAGSDLRGSDRELDFHTVKATLKYRF